MKKPGHSQVFLALKLKKFSVMSALLLQRKCSEEGGYICAIGRTSSNTKVLFYMKKKTEK